MDETIMNRSKKRFFFLHFALFSFIALCLCCCHTDSPQSGNIKTFSNDLRGKWVTNDAAMSTYSGTLVIDYETITISGYGENQTPSQQAGGNDKERPFVGFPRDIPLKGYSEEGKIFIPNYENGQNGIPYSFSEEGDYPNRVKIMKFDFGGKPQIVQRTED